MLPAAYLCAIALVSTGVMFWAPPILLHRRIAAEKELYHSRQRQQLSTGVAMGGASPSLLGTAHADSKRRAHAAFAPVSDRGTMDMSVTSSIADMDSSTTPMMNVGVQPALSHPRPIVHGSSSGSNINISINLHLQQQSSQGGAGGGMWDFLSHLFGHSAGDNEPRGASSRIVGTPHGSQPPFWRDNLTHRVGEWNADDISIVDDSCSGGDLEGHLMRGSSHGGRSCGSVTMATTGAEYVSGLVRGSVLHYPVSTCVVSRGKGGEGPLRVPGMLSSNSSMAGTEDVRIMGMAGPGEGYDETGNSSSYGRGNSYV